MSPVEKKVSKSKKFLFPIGLHCVDKKYMNVSQWEQMLLDATNQTELMENRPAEVSLWITSANQTL